MFWGRNPSCDMPRPPTSIFNAFCFDVVLIVCWGTCMCLCHLEILAPAVVGPHGHCWIDLQLSLSFRAAYAHATSRHSCFPFPCDSALTDVLFSKLHLCLKLWLHAWPPVLLAGMGIPLLLLVCLVIPLLPVLLLWRHRKQLHHEQQHNMQTTALQLRLGFIYSSYRSGTMALIA